MNELQILELPDNSYAAVFTGIDGAGNTCDSEEAHSLRGETPEDREHEALAIWGISRDDVCITHE